MIFAFENERDARVYATYVAHSSLDGYAPSVHQTSSDDFLAFATDYGFMFSFVPSGLTDSSGVEPSEFIRCATAAG